MFWDAAEATIRAYIEEQWALGVYASLPLDFENELEPEHAAYVLVNIEGTGADKTIYGTAGHRASQEYGIIFVHSFGPIDGGKQSILGPAVAMASILELQVIANSIYLEGANPPTPVEHGDGLVPGAQPAGEFYRCSISVPFNVIGTR